MALGVREPVGSQWETLRQAERKKSTPLGIAAKGSLLSEGVASVLALVQTINGPWRSIDGLTP